MLMSKRTIVCSTEHERHESCHCASARQPAAWQLVFKHNQSEKSCSAGTGTKKKFKKRREAHHAFPMTTTFPANEFQICQRGGALNFGWHLTLVTFAYTTTFFFEFRSHISSCLQMVSRNRLQLVLTNINVLRFLN